MGATMKREHVNGSLIQEYLDGTATLSADVQAHLLECVECREAVEQYREVYTAIDGSNEPRLSEAFADRVMGRVASLESKRLRGRRDVPQWLWVGGLTVGACLISALVVGPTALRDIAVQFYGLGSEGLTGFQTVTSKYFQYFNVKPITALLSIVTLGGIVLMDSLLVRVRRSRRFMSLMV